jgi:hypothetical protein
MNYKTECIFTQVEKKRNPPKGLVILPPPPPGGQREVVSDHTSSAKYIEGLENRLGRMESLLKMSGLLSDEDAGKTDLGTLEKRLAEKVSSNSEPKRRDSTKPMAAASSSSSVPPGVDSHHSTPQRDTHSSPRNSVTTPISDNEKEKNEEVENLSDMMCSLVTNNCGETRYIGRTQIVVPSIVVY